MPTNKQLNGEPFNATHTHATAAVAAKAAATGKTHYITDAAASSDKAGSILLIYDGTTVIWQEQVGAGHCELHFVNPLPGSSGAAVSVAIDGTSACKANIGGFTLKQ